MIKSFTLKRLTHSLLALVGGVVLMGWPGFVEAQRVGSLADSPDWDQLEVYQETITRDAFAAALSNVYTNGSDWKLAVKLFPERAEILKRHGTDDVFTLRFLTDDSADAEPEIARYWREPNQLPPLDGRPVLSDLHIAIDPGHIGGKWAKMEERWFTMGDEIEIMEGELTLEVGKLLKEELEKLGAKVSMVRDSLEPASQQRPPDFAGEARQILRTLGIPDPKETYKDGDSGIMKTVQWQTEKIFYRTHEIRARAHKLNAEIQPDICLCLHLNAASWGNPADPQLTSENHLHILINGTYSTGELTLDDQRFDCLQRLLQGIHTEEIALAKVVAPALAKTTKLPPYIYRKRTARQVGAGPYVWARNLLANRTFTCPVLYFEPYVMNNTVVYRRLSVGDYLGRTRISGEMRSSLFQDYVQGIVDGLTEYYATKRPG